MSLFTGGSKPVKEGLQQSLQTPGLPIPSPASQQRRNSALVAEAAARWEALEAENAELRHVLDGAQARALVLEETNNVLRSEAAMLRFENERLIRENTMIHTRITVAAETLISLRNNLSQAQSEAVLSAVAEELNSANPEQEPTYKEPTYKEPT